MAYNAPKMSWPGRFGPPHRHLVLCLGILAGAATGCANSTLRGNRQPEMILNRDVAQIQPVVHSRSFTMRDVDAMRQLAAGIYGVEDGKWRWTAGDFSVVLATPGKASTRGADLSFVFYISDPIVRRTGPITLTVYLNEAEVGEMTYTTAGIQHFSARIPPRLLAQSPVAVDFHLDRYVPAGVLENRELGVIADSVSLEGE